MLQKEKKIFIHNLIDIFYFIVEKNTDFGLSASCCAMVVIGASLHCDCAVCTIVHCAYNYNYIFPPKILNIIKLIRTVGKVQLCYLCLKSQELLSNVI